MQCLRKHPNDITRPAVAVVEARRTNVTRYDSAIGTALYLVNRVGIVGPERSPSTPVRHKRLSVEREILCERRGTDENAHTDDDD
jgi:hypothetical protein